jgi:hypothetical protein
VSSFDPHAYGPVFAPLLAIDRRRPLDAGQPDAAAKPALKKLSVETAFNRVAEESMAACCLAGIWLLHDFLDESHTISQGIETPSGSFWHAIMHRREGDFSNAKYWFRHVGDHPVFEVIAQRAQLPVWDPIAFVDRCQAAVRGKSSERDVCFDLQQIEWEALFDYCYREAVGSLLAPCDRRSKPHT